MALREAAGAYTGAYDRHGEARAEYLARAQIGAALGGVPALHSAILLRRGDVFEADDEEAYLLDAGLGGFPVNLYGHAAMVALEVQGESADKRFILSTYGAEGPEDYSEPRPVIHLSRNGVVFADDAITEGIGPPTRSVLSFGLL